MSITTYSALDAIFVNNTAHSIRGNDINNFLDSTMGVAALAVKTANYTLTESDETIIAASPGDFTVTLPACASTRVGKRYTVTHNAGSGTSTTIACSGADTVMNHASVVLVRDFNYVTVENRGDRWEVVADNGVTHGIVYMLTNSATVANTTTESSIMSTGTGNPTLPVDFFKAYTVLHIKARGAISNTGTPTLTMKVKYGSTVLGTTGAGTTASGLSSSGWELGFNVVCRSTGATGTVMGQGEFRIHNVHLQMVNTTTTTIDTTAATSFSLTAQWGTANASNTISCHELIVEVVR